MGRSLTLHTAVPSVDAYWLKNARIPLTFLDATVHDKTTISALMASPFQEDLVAADIYIQSGQIAAIQPIGSASSPAVDLHQGLVWPCFIDIHTHLDKGHIWHRSPNPTGTFQQALTTIDHDRLTRWTPEDLYRRMDFGLRCSYAHGTKAIRTHLDVFDQQAQMSLEVFRALKIAWKDRLTLQAVGLVPLDYWLTPDGTAIADQMAYDGSILGGVAFMNPELPSQLEYLFKLARERGLDVDLHTDESLDPNDMALRYVAQTKVRQDFPHAVACGHCCSLSIQTPEVAAETMRWVKDAEISIISLPMCNLYLQDRQSTHMPRYRGVTLLHELNQHGVPVALASDNCRDPFFAYGDHDGLEVFTQSVRIGHLDHPLADWPQAITQIPANIMGLSDAGHIGIGQPADLILFKARTFNELLSRPQCDRIILRQGRAIDTTLPDYAELDDLMV